MNKRRYVIGFIFNKDRSKVLLITKNKPEWQKGLLNGIGGKIENDEEPITAMRRECLEEANIILHSWMHYSTVIYPLCELYLFVSEDLLDIENYTHHSSEGEIKLYHIDKLERHKLVHNIKWMLELALDENTHYSEMKTCDASGMDYKFSLSNKY